MNPLAVTLLTVGAVPNEFEAHTHALKNCATIIVGLASCIEPYVDPVARLRASRLVEATLHLKELLTDPSRLRRSGEAAGETVRIEDIFRLVSDRLAPQAESGSVLLAIDCAGGSIVGDRTNLAEAVYNVASNALQASPPRSTVRISTRRTIDGDHEWIVEDAGCGIARSIMSRLGTARVTTRKGGMGLGLSLALQVITQHGGVMRIESTVGMGTTVTIWLPGVQAG